MYTHLFRKGSGTPIACRTVRWRPLSPAEDSGDARELRHESAPLPPPDARAEKLLSPIPGRKGALEPRSAARRQLNVSLAAVRAGPPPDPSLRLERSQCPRQRRAVENEHLTEPALRDPTGQRESLEERELGDIQSCAAELLIVDLANRPGRPPQVRARARQHPRAVVSLLGEP